MVDGSIRIDTKIDQSGVNAGLAEMEKSCTSFAGAATAILAGISVFEFGKSALKSTADIELAQAKLTTLLGNAADAQSMIADIVKMADVTPYNSNDLIQAATTLKTFGVNADQILPTLTALGNAAGGQAQNLQGVAYALGQTAAQGKMMTQDLYQFINAGVPLLDLLSKQLGKNKAAIKGMIEEGKIGYAEVNAALQTFYTGNGKYANLMAQAAKTLPGMWSTFQDSVTSFGRSLVSELEPAIKSALGFLTAMFSAFANASPAVKQLTGFVLLFAGTFATLAVGVGTARKAFELFFLVLRGNPFILIISLLSALLIKMYMVNDAAQVQTFLNPDEADRSVKIYDTLIAKQDEYQKAAERAGNRGIAEQNYRDVAASMEKNVALLDRMKYGTDAWSEKSAEIAAQYRFLENLKLAPFVRPDDLARAGDLNEKFKAIYTSKRKAAAGDTGFSGAGLDQKTADKQAAIWADYYAWKIGEVEGSLAEEIAVAQNKYANEIKDAGFTAEELVTISEKHEDEIAKIREKWAKKHEIASFLMGFGMSEKTAEGMESGVHSIVSATKDIGEAIADTFEVIGEVFDFGASVLGWIVDFNYADTETAITEYVNAIASFFQNDLGALTTLFSKTAVPLIEGLVSGLTTNLPVIVESIGNLMLTVTDYLKTNGPALISKIIAIVSALVQAVAENLPALAAVVASGFLQLLTGAVGMLPTLTKGLVDTFSAVLGSVVQAAPALIDALMAAIAYAIEYLAQNVGKIAGQLVTLALKVVEGVVRNLPQIISALTAAIPQLVSALLEDVPQAIIAELPTMIEQLVPAIIEMIPQLFAELPAVIAASAGQAMIDATILMPAEFLKASPGIIKALVVSLAEAPGQLYREFANMAGDAWKGFVEGFQRAGDIWTAVKRVFTGFVDAVKRFFGIHSPSTVFASIGRDIIRGLVLGIASVGGLVWDALNACLTFDFSGVLSTVYDFGCTLIKTLASGVTSMWSALEDLFSFDVAGLEGSIVSIGSTIVDAIKSGITAPINLFIDTINDVISALNKIHVKLPKWLGGYSFGIDLPYIDKLATGTKNARGGWTVVGENGPEMVNLKSGATVLNASDSIRAVMAALTPRTAGSSAAQSISISGDISAADVVIDGNTVGRIAFKYIDRQVKAAYGA